MITVVFTSYWNSDNNMTYPLILAKIPVKNPWEIFSLSALWWLE